MTSGRVYATETTGANQGNNVTVAADGSYQMALFPGTYNVSLYHYFSESWDGTYTGFETLNYQAAQNLTISADTTLDIPVVLYTLTGRVTDTNGQGVSNVALNTWGMQCSSWTNTSADGSYKLFLLPGTYSIQITPPPALFPPFEVKKVHITGDSSRNIVLSYDYAALDQALALLPSDLELHLDVFDIIDQGTSQSYDIAVSTPRDLLEIIINWGGSEMLAEVFQPDGTLYGDYQSGAPPIIVDIPNPDVGTWTCQVTAIDIPYDNYPIAVVVGITPNEPPVADANGPYSGSVGSPITFDASGSCDPDGDIVLYEWDWDNDGIYDESTTSATITHTWDAEFTGTIALRVSDNEGLTTLDSASVKVSGIEGTTPKKFRQLAMDALSDLLPTGDDKTDKRIEKAVEHIEKSLAPELWETEFSLTEKGKKVFDEEKKAVKELIKIENGPAVSQAITYLLEADRVLAQIAIDDAVAAGGDAKKIAKARKETGKAQAQLDKGKYDKAIVHNNKAWEHAQKAMK